MSPSKLVSCREREYEAQLFGFSCNDVYEFMKDNVHAEFEKSGECLKQFLLQGTGSKQGIEEAVKSVVEKSCQTAQPHLERMKEQLPLFFGLPPHVLLPEDRKQREAYTQSDEERERDNITKLVSRIRRAKFMKSVYEEELVKISQMKQQLKLLEDVLPEIEKLKQIHRNNNQAFKQFHRVVQNILGLEVQEASLQLSDRPNAAESVEVLEEAIYDAYTKS